MTVRRAGTVRALLLVLALIGVGFVAGRFTAAPNAASGTAPYPVSSVPEDISAETHAASIEQRDAPAPLDKLAQIIRIPGGFEQRAALYALTRAADRIQLEALLDEAEHLEQPRQRRIAMSILLSWLAELDPEAALARVAERSYLAWNLRPIVFEAVARVDLEMALIHVRTLEPKRRAQIVVDILRIRRDLDPASRRLIAEKFGVVGMLEQISALRRAMVAAIEDPAGAWRAALADGRGPRRKRRLEMAVRIWARRDPVAALRATDALERRSTRSSLADAAIEVWAQDDAHAALQWVQAQPRHRPDMLRTTLRELAHTDPRLAASTAARLTGTERRLTLIAVLGTWAANDPQAAAGWLVGKASADVRHASVGSMAAYYALAYPGEVMSWIGTLQPTDRAAALPRAIGAVASRDPLLAQRLLSDIPEPELRTRAAQSLAQSWALTGPRAAVDWAATLPSGEPRSKVLGPALVTLAIDNRDAALAYLERVQRSEVFDRLAPQVLIFFGERPDAQERLFHRITDAAVSREVARDLHRAWKGEDPERAQRYRQASGAEPAAL